MNETTTIRINKKVYLELKNIAEDENETMQSVIEKAVEDYKTKRFFDELGKSVQKAKSNSQSWEEVLKERKEWESTLPDGLEVNEDGTW